MVRRLPKGKQKPGRVVKPVYNYVQALYLSFFSGKLYIDVKQRWKGMGATYLFILCAMLTLPWSALILWQQSSFYNSQVVPAIKQMPPLTVKKGKISFDKKSPFIIKSNVTKKPLIIIDTSGSVKSLKDRKYDSVLLLVTDNSIITKQAGLPESKHAMDKELSGVISTHEMMAMYDKAKLVFSITLFPTFATTLFVAEFMIVMLFSVIAMFYAKAILNYDMGFRESVRVCCVAATPKLLVLFILFQTSLKHSHTLGLVLFFVFLGYYTFAVIANKRAAKDLVVSSN